MNLCLVAATLLLYLLSLMFASLLAPLLLLFLAVIVLVGGLTLFIGEDNDGVMMLMWSGSSLSSSLIAWSSVAYDDSMGDENTIGGGAVVLRGLYGVLVADVWLIGGFNIAEEEEENDNDDLFNAWLEVLAWWGDEGWSSGSNARCNRFITLRCNLDLSSLLDICDVRIVVKWFDNVSKYDVCNITMICRWLINVSQILIIPPEPWRCWWVEYSALTTVDVIHKVYVPCIQLVTYRCSPHPQRRNYKS